MSCALCAVADCVVTWWSSYSARKMYIYFACKTIFFSTLHLSFDPFIINSELLRNDLNSISVRLVEMLGRRSTKREPDNQNEKLFPHRWFPNGETIRMSAQETKRVSALCGLLSWLVPVEIQCLFMSLSLLDTVYKATSLNLDFFSHHGWVICTFRKEKSH